MPYISRNIVRRFLISVSPLILFSIPVVAADFVVNTPSSSTRDLAAGETGEVTESGSLSYSGQDGVNGFGDINGGDGIAITTSGDNVRIINDGIIGGSGGTGDDIGGLGSEAGDGGDGVGVDLSNNNAMLINSGTIHGFGGTGGEAFGSGFPDGRAFGGDGIGIRISGDNGSIINNGTLAATQGTGRMATDVTGILVLGENNTITNNGTITLNGSPGTSVAIQINGNNTLRLGANSNIQDDIIFNGGVTGGVVEQIIRRAYPEEGGGFAGVTSASLDNISGAYNLVTIFDD